MLDKKNHDAARQPFPLAWESLVARLLAVETGSYALPSEGGPVRAFRSGEGGESCRIVDRAPSSPRSLERSMPESNPTVRSAGDLLNRTLMLVVVLVVLGLGGLFLALRPGSLSEGSEEREIEDEQTQAELGTMIVEPR